MDRNFFRRIEICFPVLDKKLKKRVIAEGLKIYLKDNCQAWEMDGEGHYRLKKVRRTAMLSAQIELLAQLSSPVVSAKK
jgi:polyphosphate kinase